MNFIIVFGPLAVGKMTVGQELEKITDLKLFHNHMTIDMLLTYFDMKSSSFKNLVDLFRIKIFEEVAKSDMPGLIFTYVWELDARKDCDFINKIVGIFEQENATVYFVELEVSAEERLERNKSPNRLKYKPSKSNIKVSKKELLETDRKHILNTAKDEFKSKNHIKINNTNIKPEIVAKMIVEEFKL